MANVELTTAQNSGFIPQFWANRALEVLRANLMLARLCAKDDDFGPTDFAKQGSTLTIGYPGTFSAVDKTEGTPVTPQVPSNGSDVQLTLSKHKVVPFLIEDFANAQANLNLMDRYLNPAVVAIAEQVETDLFSLYAGMTQVVGTPGTAIVGSTVRSARQTLNQNRVPMANRSLIISPGDEISLLGDSTLQTYFAFSQTQALKEGSIGRLYGFDLYMSQLVPAANSPVWTVTLGSGNTGGTFTLTFNGQTTAGIAYNATGATVQTAFLLLSSVGAGNATVTGSAGGPYTVTFTGSLANTSLALTGSGAALTGGSATLTSVNSDATTNKNLAIAPESFLFATRPFADVPMDSGVQIATAVDPPSGLSIRIACQYDINNMGMRCNLDILYGFINLRPNVGCVVES